ncbi:MAG: CubicO group peptidase (beta-lactamase class C family), partial [Parvicellaceae bacterium]
STFYKPLGLKTMGYHPLTNLDTNKHRITPTEYDTYWRGEVLKGYVHDPTAALFGGEAGSAGLFSNVHDLGIFYQMLLNGGTYGGKRYLQKSTVDLFTRHQPGTFRGLGFNKPTGQRSSTKSIDCPTTGYGHTGFTGICVWVDPVNDLIFVFCSNRVHPSPRNNKINTKGIRARMHQVLYNQILGRPETRDTTMLP